MCSSRLEGGRLILERTAAERKPIIQRLNRIEGQVRGLKTMIENDRYCPEELHQIKAVIAALKQVALIIADQHLTTASEHSAGFENKQAASLDMKRVLKEMLKF